MEPTKPKALYASFDHIPGPTGTACWSVEVIRALSRRCDLDGLTLKNEDLSHIERFHKARLLRVPLGGGPFRERIKTFRRALHRQLGSEDYRLVHFTSIWEGMELCSQKKSHSYKLVYEIHRLPSIDFRLSNPEDAQEIETSLSLKQQEERCFALADQLIAGSELVAKHLERRGVSASKISVVTPAVNLAPFERVGPPSGGIGTILYLGSIKPWQGVELLLHALAGLPRHIRTRLMVVAPREQPWDKELRELVQRLGLTRSVEFLDPVPFEDLPALVSQASICVAPLSNHERNRIVAPVPHKVLVYMAARRPVVAPQQPAFRDLVEHGVHGLLYPPNDVAGLAEALMQLLLDRELGVRLGNQARAHLEEHFGLERSLARLVEVWERLAGPLPELETAPARVADTDEQPLEAPPDTRKVLAGEASPSAAADKFGADTAPVPLRPAQAEPPPDTHPDRSLPAASPAEADLPEELSFSAVEAAPPGLPGEETDADRWQVLDMSQVQLAPPRRKAPAPEDGQPPTDPARPRYLLGGPPYPVEADGETPGSETQRAPTQRGGVPRGQGSGPAPAVSAAPAGQNPSQAPAGKGPKPA
ncbi:MAG TPA: glycosyltransferase [Myxococcota bacterium]|nr:glycosyltransferase [Myxococcota bacterium]HRY96729.1 glycosyltransferase [Myxococcota bacterium]HSA22403.1 glycosyltransferase [Myxococcota bacterium]